MYLQSLLRDRLFTIRTDHQNLLSINMASNLMIVRSYMALSEFSFNLSFIRGANNDVADAISRLAETTLLTLVVNIRILKFYHLY